MGVRPENRIRYYVTKRNVQSLKKDDISSRKKTDNKKNHFIFFYYTKEILKYSLLEKPNYILFKKVIIQLCQRIFYEKIKKKT